MLRSKRIRWAAEGAFLLLVIGGAFLFGPLFPWSPIKPGYKSLKSSRAEVFLRQDAALDERLHQVDAYMAATEEFHQLKFRSPMRIIICSDWDDFHRFLPTVRSTSFAAVTPEYGTTIFITPRVAASGLDLGEFVRHELSHALLQQNSFILNSYRFKRVPWLFEGIAVLSADQHTYGTWQDFFEFAQAEDMSTLFRGVARGVDMRYAYLAWRYFMEWLIHRHGRPAFQQLMMSAMDRPLETERIFQDVYRQPLDEEVELFQKTVRNMPSGPGPSWE